jgi:transposase
MTSTTKAATAERILAIDLGKYKSVLCEYRTGNGEVSFTTIDTTYVELRKQLNKRVPDVVVIEACALSGWVYDLCSDLRLCCRVANTNGEAWKFKHSKRKTDHDDALRLAQLEALHQLPTVTIPAKSVREWRALIAHRQALVCRRVTIQNKIRAILVVQGLPTPRGAKAWTELGLAGLAQLAKPLADCAAAELWRGRLERTLIEYRQVLELATAVEKTLDGIAAKDRQVQLLLSVPGVGPRTAEIIAAYLDDPHRFRNASEVSAYAGLVPRQFQSGEVDRRGRITKRGPALLRKLLVECAWCSLRYNAWARSVYVRLTAGGTSRKKPAIVAVARRLLIRCWAVLRTGHPWRSEAA